MPRCHRRHTDTVPPPKVLPCPVVANHAGEDRPVSEEQRYAPQWSVHFQSASRLVWAPARAKVPEKGYLLPY